MVCVTRTQRVPWSAAVGSHTSCAQGPTFTRTSEEKMERAKKPESAGKYDTRNPGKRNIGHKFFGEVLCCTAGGAHVPPDQRLDEVTAADAVELARLASKLG
eukprot:m.754094 g.754094  ORF g.754094 m.754094 type:complete len:102 (+) comp58998_c0_seq6:1119-1424(+)